MAPKERSEGILEQWIAEVGEDLVVAAVEAARLDIAEGRLPGLSDKDELREYLRYSHRRTS